jgi:lactoylglutathione lyase
MRIDHVAIWTTHLEELRNYYSIFFGGKPSWKYINPITGFESYFITFDSDTKLEIMSEREVKENRNNLDYFQYQGIAHIAFGMESMQLVDEKANQLEQAGYKILKGPRKTGDGFYVFDTLDPDKNRVEVTTKYIETFKKT